jgi:D-ribose pyranase
VLRGYELLNPALLSHLAAAGHTDIVLIADAGMPLPPGVPVVDLSLVPGVPSFAETASAVLAALVVESAVIAAQAREHPAGDELARLLAGIPVKVITHAELQLLSQRARVVVRTGECSPYMNVALVAGVTF